MSGLFVRDLDERRLLNNTTRQIITIFLLSALSYMLGVAWYEALRATVDQIERDNPQYSHLQIVYIYTGAVTLLVFSLAILIHFLTQRHAARNEVEGGAKKNM